MLFRFFKNDDNIILAKLSFIPFYTYAFWGREGTNYEKRVCFMMKKMDEPSKDGFKTYLIYVCTFSLTMTTNYIFPNFKNKTNTFHFSFF